MTSTLSKKLNKKSINELGNWDVLISFVQTQKRKKTNYAQMLQNNLSAYYCTTKQKALNFYSKKESPHNQH